MCSSRARAQGGRRHHFSYAIPGSRKFRDAVRKRWLSQHRSHEPHLGGAYSLVPIQFRTRIIEARRERNRLFSRAIVGMDYPTKRNAPHLIVGRCVAALPENCFTTTYLFTLKMRMARVGYSRNRMFKISCWQGGTGSLWASLSAIHNR